MIKKRIKVVWVTLTVALIFILYNVDTDGIESTLYEGSMNHDTLHQQVTDKPHGSSKWHCKLPCKYPEIVDLRIIVLTYNRPASLQKCLYSIKRLQLNGSKVAVEIWIDRNVEGSTKTTTKPIFKFIFWEKIHIQCVHTVICLQLL